MLRCLNGLEEFDSGSVSIDGLQLAEWFAFAVENGGGMLAALEEEGQVEHVELGREAGEERVAVRLAAQRVREADPVVIEVNGNPGLRTLELAGRSDLIRAIWISMLNACLGS